MCKPHEAQEGFIYGDAHEVISTETLVDEEGTFVDHVPLEHGERCVRTRDGSFGQVKFDREAPQGEIPWVRTGRKVIPPLELKPVNSKKLVHPTLFL